MFDTLSDKINIALKKLTKQAVLTESNIADAMRDIRLALLEADVNFQVAKEFVEEVKTDCLGASVLKSVTPGQQVIKIVNDKLVKLMGTSESSLDLSSTPSVIMLVGLHGSGKTTTAAKLANHLKKTGKRVLLVAGDIYRPSAIDQLEILGKEINVDVYCDRNQSRVDLIAEKAKAMAKQQNFNVVIIDTAGRFQIDEDMIRELVITDRSVSSKEIILVADAALGQEAVAVADAFHKALGLTGVILTKLDGDARGGAALSIRKVTNCPIKMVGIGEKIDDFEVFYPDRMASRILGMGDVVSLVEKAAEEIDLEEAAKLEKKLKANQLDLSDFLDQLRQMKKLGGMEKILGMLPGGKALANANIDTKKFNSMEAIICSMTSKERKIPEIIDFSRKKRIAKGSGTTVEQINALLNQFSMMKKVMKKPTLMRNIMSSMGSRLGMGGMPSMPSMPSVSSMLGGGGGFAFQRGPNRIKKKEKRKKKR